LADERLTGAEELGLVAMGGDVPLC
jgi:hypothetical protein